METTTENYDSKLQPKGYMWKLESANHHFTYPEGA